MRLRRDTLAGLENRSAERDTSLSSFRTGVVSVNDEHRADSVFGYRLETDVVYGQGQVLRDNKIVQRDLLLDVYRPTEPGRGSPLPAVVLVHGGAHHRGGRRQPPFKEAGAVHSPMEDYARLLAPLGYVCFVIEYRLAPELPQPETRPDAPNLVDPDKYLTPAGLERVNFAREAMGLPALPWDQAIVVWNSAMAGAEDTRKAIEHVRSNSADYNVDPTKIALGGHSAGGGNTLNATFGLKAPVAAIFPLSPPGMLFRKRETIVGADLPPTLLLVSQNDLPVILEPTPDLIRHMRAAEIDYEMAWVPGFPHFYPSGAVSLADDGSRLSVGDRIVRFLERHLGGGHPGR